MIYAALICASLSDCEVFELIIYSFNLLVLLNFKAIKVSILSVNTTNKLSFVKLNLRELSRKGLWFLNLLRSLFG